MYGISEILQHPLSKMRFRFPQNYKKNIEQGTRNVQYRSVGVPALDLRCSLFLKHLKFLVLHEFNFTPQKTKSARPKPHFVRNHFSAIRMRLIFDP